MHPEILRELTVQRSRDLRERAQLARMLRIVRRGRKLEADGFVVPAIPDYVDGSFRTGPDEEVGQVPAARHA